jgi:putative sporulation protein YtaF
MANNIDNIGARIAYSILGIKIKFSINLWVSCITFVISFMAAYCGKQISNLLSKQVSSEISAVILASIGIWIMLAPHMSKQSNKKNVNCKNNPVGNILEDPTKADLDCSKDIDFKEATLLGIALSINNIGGGLGAGVMGLNSVYVGIFSSVISFLALLAGNYITDIFSKFDFNKVTPKIAGIILILIALKQLY